MKIQHILSLLLIMIGTACSDQDMIEIHDTNGEVNVVAGFTKSRVSFNEADSVIYANWQDGDVITLSTPTQENLNYITNISDNISNKKFLPVENGLKDVDGEIVYACYPEAVISEGVVALPTTKMWTDTNPLPFSYAVSKIAESKVNLQFKHIFAFLKLTISKNTLESTKTTEGDKSVHRILIKSTSGSLGLVSGSFNFEDRSINIIEATNEVEFKLTTPFNPSEESERNVYIPILPQEGGVTMTINLIHDYEGGQEVLVEMNKETPENGFMAGNVYATDVEIIKDIEMAYLCRGGWFNNRIKELANGHSVSSNMTDSLIKRIEFKVENNTLPEDYVIVSDDYSPEPVYASFNPTDSLLTVFTSAKSIGIVDASWSFAQLKGLNSIDFGNFIVNKATTDLKNMFYDCSSLTNLDVSNWDTSNITDLSGMFRDCSSLTTLDVSNWDTSNVSDMYQMFYGCSTLTTLNVTNWNMSNVTTMSHMFNRCSSLTTLDVTNWNTSNVTTMNDMFVECSSLITLNVSNWNTSKVTDMGRMFWGCSSLSTLDVSTWNISNVTNMRYTFGSCSSLTALDVSNWDMSNVTDMACMFSNCSSLTTLDVSNWNISNVTGMADMFRVCSSLSTLNVSAWNTSNVSDMSHAFDGCRALTTLDVSNWNTSNVTNMSSLFYYCDALTSVDTSQWNTSNVTNMHGMFYYCHSLSTLDTSNWDTSKVTDMCFMFYQCYDLFKLDTSKWNTTNVTDMSYMFSLCSIENLDASNWDTSNVTDMTDMFSSCQNLAKLNISKWIFKDETLVDNMFSSCGSYKNGFEITCTKATQDFLLDKVNTDIVVWVIVE